MMRVRTSNRLSRALDADVWDRLSLLGKLLWQAKSNALVSVGPTMRAHCLSALGDVYLSSSEVGPDGTTAS